MRRLSFGQRSTPNIRIHHIQRQSDPRKFQRFQRTGRTVVFGLRLIREFENRCLFFYDKFCFRELEEQINQKECQITKLKHWLERERNNATLTRESERLIEVENKSTQCDCVKSISNRELEEQIKQQESEIKVLKQRLEKDKAFNSTRESETLTELENRSTDCDCEKTEMLISYRDLEKQMKQKESQIKLLKQRLERAENNSISTREETERVMEVGNRCTQCDCGKPLFEDDSCDRGRSGETCGCKRLTTSFNSPKDRKTEHIPFEDSGNGMASSTPLPTSPNATQRSPQTFIKRFFGDRWVSCLLLSLPLQSDQ